MRIDLRSRHRKRDDAGPSRPSPLARPPRRARRVLSYYDTIQRLSSLTRFAPRVLALSPPPHFLACVRPSPALASHLSAARLLVTRPTMPPKAAPKKRTAKRKAEDSDDAAASPPPAESSGTAAKAESEPAENGEEDEEDAKPAKAKKAKKEKEPVRPLDPSLPTNKTVPETVEPFERPAEGTVRISAWNVAGLRACEKKGALRGRFFACLAAAPLDKSDMSALDPLQVSLATSTPKTPTSSSLRRRRPPRSACLR